MEGYKMFCYKWISVFVFFFVVDVGHIIAQGNCLLYGEGSGERIACELSYEAIKYRQGSKESQMIFDEAIKAGPNYAWAYYQKSVPFFKRALFADGIKLINKAIELEPENYLHYRAYWYFYNRSYKMCASDLDRLYGKHQVSYISTPGGELEMRLLLGMSLARIGELTKGIEWVEHLMNIYKERPNLKGFYDHYVLGFLYYENGDLAKAKKELEKQIEVEPKFADTYYYLGLIERQGGDEALARRHFNQAKERMKRNGGGYSANLFADFNLFLKDVEREMMNEINLLKIE